MRTAITIGLDAKGLSSLLHGPEHSFGDQRSQFEAARASGTLPKNCVRLEFWSSDGRLKILDGKKIAAQKAMQEVNRRAKIAVANEGKKVTAAAPQ